jgi:hypothetical protein
MYIRRANVKGETYYSIVQGYRDEFGRSRHRVIVSLGRSPSIPEAIESTRARLGEDGDLFLRVLREYIRLLDEDEFDVPSGLRRIAAQARAIDADRTEVLGTLIEDAGLTDDIVRDEVDGSEPDDQLSPPSWVLRKLTQLDRRMREDQTKLEKLEELKPEFARKQAKQ